MPIVVRPTERSWAITLISDINMSLQTMGLRIKHAGGENTISTGHQSMFPDVLLYGDTAQTQILQGWELKLPDTAITDQVFIEDAQRKAISLGLNSFFIWNFTAGVLYVKNDQGMFMPVRQWNETSHVRTRSDVERYRNEWLPVIQNILIEINQYLVRGEICTAELCDILSDTMIFEIVNRNRGVTAEELSHACIMNTRHEAFLTEWWNGVSAEYSENNKYNAYASTVLINWAVRIIFAHLIKHRHNAAMVVDDFSFTTQIHDANQAFEQMTSTSDFYNVFRNMELDEHLPDTAWHDLMDLNLFLKGTGVHAIEQAALQTVLERLVTSSVRELKGQFATPMTLADILVQLTVHNWQCNVIDPCCGTGTIAKTVLSHKRDMLDNVQQAVETTWASDKFSLPLQLANVAMTGEETINLPIHLFRCNVFSLQEGAEITVTDPQSGQPLVFHLPKVGAVTSNLPFIPFENISTEDKMYINALSTSVKTNTGIQLSNRTDYYAHIVFSLHDILEDDGYLGVITSNSWLGTTAGKNFYKAINHYYQLEQVHISNAGRWFQNAQIVTVLVILKKRNTIAPPSPNEVTAFCAWNKELSNLQGDDVGVIVRSSLLERELDRTVMSYQPYTAEEISAFLSMHLSLTALFDDVRWLLEIQDKLIPILDIFDVVRGERRGWNSMFYPERGHGIEPQYIQRALRSSRAITHLCAQPDSDAFCCSEPIETLRDIHHEGALAWIARFEHGVNNVGQPLPESLARTNMHWYEMRMDNIADFVTSVNPGERLFFARFPEPAFFDQRLTGLRCKEQRRDTELYHALLNSLLGMFFLEAIGFGRGLGALDINSTTIRNAYMLNPELISIEHRQVILQKFDVLLHREIKKTIDELAAEDRRDFDLAVLSAYGIEDYYDKIKASLLFMQQMRLNAR